MVDVTKLPVLVISLTLDVISHNGEYGDRHVRRVYEWIQGYPTVGAQDCPTLRHPYIQAVSTPHTQPIPHDV